MKKTTIVILLLVTGIPIFAKWHQTRKHHNPNEIISVESRHTACYGHCPVYTVAVNRDGTVTYTGIRFTKDSGIFQKNIGKEKAKEILDSFSTYMADTCQDLYKSRATDLPGITLTITYPGKTKVIRNANLGPMSLRILYASVDRLFKGKIDETWHAANAPVK